MAYVIERIPKEEWRGYKIPGYKEIVPHKWVIDREKDIKLFKYWTNIDEPHEEYFALIWKSEVMKVVLIKDFVAENTVRWRLYQIWRGPDELLSELRDAMEIYGFSGNPFLKKKKESKTIIDF